ncbi:MAG: LemA family protein [Dehalococcoidia bacterium]|jgi:LemA protein|nr:LemA family protein [Chloroflexota bacterium]MCK4242907.1 LemA family protein [Dehalococcoidia bacterium]
MIAIYIIIGIVVLLLLIFVGIYNSLVRLRNQVRNAWAQIDVQLKRRHDLIPNLMETVKGYMKHERETLEAVTNARNLAQGAIGKGVGAQSKAEGELSGALSKLLAVVENYPDLKANQNFLALQEELTSTENKIGFSRQFYNDSVLGYNNKTQMFPSNVVAGATGFKAGEFFEVEVAAEREAPKVSFS